MTVIGSRYQGDGEIEPHRDMQTVLVILLASVVPVAALSLIYAIHLAYTYFAARRKTRPGPTDEEVIETVVSETAAQLAVPAMPTAVAARAAGTPSPNGSEAARSKSAGRFKSRRARPAAEPDPLIGQRCFTRETFGMVSNETTLVGTADSRGKALPVTPAAVSAVTPAMPQAAADAAGERGSGGSTAARRLKRISSLPWFWRPSMILRQSDSDLDLAGEGTDAVDDQLDPLDSKVSRTSAPWPDTAGLCNWDLVLEHKRVVQEHEFRPLSAVVPMEAPPSPLLPHFQLLDGTRGTSGHGERAGVLRDDLHQQRQQQQQQQQRQQHVDHEKSAMAGHAMYTSASMDQDAVSRSIEEGLKKSAALQAQLRLAMMQDVHSYTSHNQHYQRQPRSGSALDGGGDDSDNTTDDGLDDNDDDEDDDDEDEAGDRLDAIHRPVEFGRVSKRLTTIEEEASYTTPRGSRSTRGTHLSGWSIGARSVVGGGGKHQYGHNSIVEALPPIVLPGDIEAGRLDEGGVRPLSDLATNIDTSTIAGNAAAGSRKTMVQLPAAAVVRSRSQTIRRKLLSSNVF